MRIIAGSLRRRTLEAPAGLATRPTSDRLRETLFNVLAPRIEGARFLDLYAGSGAVGIEALSRGANDVTFAERSPAALKVLRGNLARLGVTAGFHVHPGNVGAYLRRARPDDAAGFDIVFLDPPYDEEDEYALALGLLGGSGDEPRSQSRDLEHTLLAENTVVIAEHRRKEKLRESYGRLARTRLLEQGDAALSFFELG